MTIAGAGGVAPKNDTNDAFAISLGSGDKIETGGSNIARLHALCAAKAFQNLIVSAISPTLESKGLAGKQIVILRKTIYERAC